MSSLQDDSTPAALEHTARPVSWRKYSPVKTDMSLTDPASHVDPNEPDTATPHQPARPTTTEEKRVWREGQHAMTYTAWLANEKELDDAFRTWRDTDDGKREVAEVYSRFPGLRRTSMGAEDVSWFVREMSTPGTYLRTTWDAAHSDPNTKPLFSIPQLKLLVLLASPRRSLNTCNLPGQCQQLFLFYGFMEWRNIFGPEAGERSDEYDRLFPHYGYLEGNLLDWPKPCKPEGRGIPMGYGITLPPGEEGLLTTERYLLNKPLYWDIPPYIPSSRIYPGTTAKGITDLPAEVLDKIFKRVGLFGGPIIMALKDQQSAHAPSRFHATFALPTHRINIDRCMVSDWDTQLHPCTKIPKILDLRRVCRKWGDMIRDVFFQNTFVFRCEDHGHGSMSQNVWAISTSMREDRYNLADFKIRFNPILTDGVVQPFEGSDEVGFDYEEEVVHLGASRNTGRMIFGTDAPCDRTFVKKWINSQLFLDDGGHLAVRAFRLKFDPGTHARELSKQWLSDIFQHLHRRGIGGKSAGSNTLLLDWNARDL
ncbi:uncharacterized protein J4E79_000496 [Alternaria viburni]|uniref:uncharacterized protein n=1 Tax=Alternaria viburni TaxID=566460 RepID=UPI0020C503AD|nr:uncharacterized protein J4E79_000496 [Alternaria viburni]KAI4670215.1 hypothetical protein J4E79_000496 [Alternaria viburni]